MDLGEFRLARTLQYQAQSERKIEVVRQLLVQEPDFNSYQLFRYLAGNKDFISQADLIAFLHENNFFITREDAASLVARYSKQSTISYQDFFVNLELPNLGEIAPPSNSSRRPDAVGYKVLLAHKMRTEVEANRNISVMKDLLAEELGDNFYRSFRRADVSRDGFLTIGDIRAILAKFSITLTDAELDCLLRRYDSNKDGRISYLDFLTQLMPDGRLDSLRTPYTSPMKASSQLDRSYTSPNRSMRNDISSITSPRRTPVRMDYLSPNTSIRDTSYMSPNRSTRDTSYMSPNRSMRDTSAYVSPMRSRPQTSYSSPSRSAALNSSYRSPRRDLAYEDLNLSQRSERIDRSLNRSRQKNAERLAESYRSPRASPRVPEAKVDLEGEIEAMRQRLAMHPSFTLLNAFKHLDVNNKGYITISELKRALTDAGHFVTRDELASCVRLFDTNGDGRISYSEFIAKMMPTESIYSELVSSPSAGGIRYERRLSIPAQLDLANALKQRIDQQNDLNELDVSKMYAWED